MGKIQHLFWIKMLEEKAYGKGRDAKERGGTQYIWRTSTANHDRSASNIGNPQLGFRIQMV